MFFRSGGTPSKSRADYWIGTIPWVSAKDMKVFRLHDSEDHVTAEAIDAGSRLAPAGSIFLLVRGMTLHKDIPICVAMRDMAFNQDIKALMPRAGVDGAFLTYWLLAQKPTLLSSVDSAGHGTGRLNTDTLKAMEVALPPLAEQKAIVHILGALDDKIELKRKMNETLEEMARALFKSWFVDFDPVRAKLDGRQPAGMDAAAAALFPSEFQESELGPIPKGWEIIKVGDIGAIICGKTPPTSNSDYYGEDIPFITIPDMHSNVFATMTSRKLSFAGANSQANKTLPAGSICVSCIATPGLVVITSEASQTNQQINSIVPDQKDEIYFWYMVMNRLGSEISAHGAGGSVLINLSKGRFENLKVMAPQKGLIRTYHNTVSPLFEVILNNTFQSRILANLRDTLLPKLLSGEISVKHAAEMAEGAAA